MSHRWTRGLLIAGIGVIAVWSALATPAWVIGSPRQQAAPQQAASPCSVTAAKSAAPSVVRLGDEITVTLVTRFTCPDAVPPLHLVLALDGSGSMAGQPNQKMKQAVTQLVRSLDLPSSPDTQVAVVEFNTLARTLCHLTNVENQAIGCVNRIGAAGGTRIDVALQQSLRELAAGRAGTGVTPREAILLITDGQNNAGCPPVLSMARQIRGQGVLLATVGFGTDIDEACLRQAASSPGLFYDVPDPNDLSSALAQFAVVLEQAGAAWLEVIEVPGVDMATVASSMRPPGTVLAGGSLTWMEAWPASTGVTMTVRLRPGRLGYLPADQTATGTLIDYQGRSRTWTYPVPWAMVVDPSTPPTVTVTLPPTPTPTMTPLTPPTPLPSPTPTYGVPMTVCREIAGSVPPAAVAAAVADPASVAGYGRLCQPSLPAGPGNTVRGSLSVQSPSKPYHPTYNSLVWKCGCP